jgi:hypothetical protein
MLDTQNAQHAADVLMAGRRVLAVLPPSNRDRTKSIISFLQAAKARWGIRVDVVCRNIERRGFESLAAPSGQFFFVPQLLQSQDWERDHESVAATERLMHEAEQAARLPIGRLIMGASHTVGRAYNTPVRRVRSYALVRRVLKDNSEPFRIVRRMFRFADDVLAAANPDFVFAYEYATLLNRALWLAAKRRGIPCVVIRYSKINSEHAYWSTDPLMMNTLATERAKAKREDGAAVSEAAKARLKAFREQPATVQYIVTRWWNITQRGFLRWHLQYARVVVREFINGLRGQDRALAEPPGSRLLRYYWSIITAYWQQRYRHSFDEAGLADMKYVYFPLHKDAEIALTVQATAWYDQRNTVRILASMLPFGYRLLVREHRLNHLHRTTRSYRELAQIPNVVLIDPFDSQFKYLRHADLVVTENGSSGWEGFVLGRRVIVLSRTFYDGAALGTKVEEPDRLNAAILESLAKPPVADPVAHDHALGCVIEAELETTFPLNVEGAPAALDRLAETIESLLRARGARAA